MKQQPAYLAAFIATIALSMGPNVLAQQQPAGIFFRETWKAAPKKDTDVNAKASPEVPGSYTPGNDEIPLTADGLSNPNLQLRLYGNGKEEVRIAHILAPPIYVWSGLVHSGNWAVLLKDKTNYVDLSGPGAKIRWNIKEAGFHQLRPVLKLADGTFLVGDYAEGYSADWSEKEFPVSTVHWRGLDGDKVVETPDGKVKANVDLSKVDEIGFTDLALGSGHGAGGASRVNWIEVYGNPVRRTGASN